ncbi:MAG TPA: CehA/McbA family metallohydrolase [Candidatus Bathyarchaeia archaeon]
MSLSYVNPFKEPGVWLKGNLHTHTVHSDGHLTPEQHAKRYREAGYGFLAITDHGKYVDTRSLSRRGLTMIQGEELSAGRSAAGTLYHLVALGIREGPPFEEADPAVSPQAVIDYVNGAGGLVALAHPYWSGLTHGEAMALKGFAAVEAYNHVCELLNDRGDAAAHWDHMLTAGRRVNAIAVDDAHSKEREHMPDDSFGGWVVARCRDRSEKAILDAIRMGLYYSSSGPTIEGVEVGDGEVSVTCSPAEKIAFVSVPCLGVCYKAAGDTLTGASYSLRPGERYVRVQVTDSRGGRAWTNPIYVE